MTERDFSALVAHELHLAMTVDVEQFAADLARLVEVGLVEIARSGPRAERRD
jgi:hypothetical protein